MTPTASDAITWLTHSKTRLALHCLRSGEGPRLLLLHGLGQHATLSIPEAVFAWPGPIHALDFCGHGQSTSARGGGYTCEILMADADAALAELGNVSICGRGLGSYIALLIAGGRPELVDGVTLCDGPGLAGGGSQPAGPAIHFPDPNGVGPPDPFVLVELARDLRPPDYVIEFARRALEQSRVDPAVVVCAAESPEWLAVVADIPGVERMGLEAALRCVAAQAAGAEEG